MRSLSFCCLFAFATASGAFASSVPTGFTTKVQCDDLNGVAGFANEAVILDLGGRTVALPQTVAASGARYENVAENVMFWMKGLEAQLEWEGSEMTCDLSPSNASWIASGNEPGWRLSVAEGQIRAEFDYGETVVEHEMPLAEVQDGALTYHLPDFDFSVRHALCHDDMSGRPYPEQVTLERSGATLRGCAGDTMDLLNGPEWLVEDIAGAGIIDSSHVTLAFDGTRIAGSAGCNRFMGSFDLTGEGAMRFGPLAATQMMCPEALMAQEGAFLGALSQVERFDLDETGALILYGPVEPVLTARR